MTSSDLTGLLEDVPHTIPADRLLVVDDPGHAAALDAAPRIEGHRPHQPTTTSSSSSSPRARPACPRPCAAPRAASAAPAPTSPPSPSSPPTTSCTRHSPSSTPHPCSPGGPQRSTPASRSRPAAASPRPAPFPTSAPSAPRSSPTPARSSTTSSRSPRPPTMPTSRSAWRSATRPPSTTSASSPVGSAAPSATATDRPKASSSSAATPSMPTGALGTADDSVKVLDPDTGMECPRAVFDDHGRVVNLEDAVGEIVETQPTSGFEGYYRNPAATEERFRDGAYWSGDLAYRDADGWLFFAGRSNDWLRVDGENFAAGPVEAIIARHPDVRSVAVYAVPDDPVGDRVMVGLELARRRGLDPAAFDEFLRAQPDLGPKWIPAFVRVDAELPKLSSMKIDKKALRRDAWRVEGVLWRPSRHERPPGPRPTSTGRRSTPCSTGAGPPIMSPRPGTGVPADEPSRPRDRPAVGAAFAQGGPDPGPSARRRQGGVRDLWLPGGPHHRHRRAGRPLARILLPLLRFQGADLPRGGRGPGGAPHPSRRRRRRGRSPER